MKIVEAFRRAVKKEENWDHGAEVIWDFVDADIYMEVKLNERSKDEYFQYAKMFDALADTHEANYSGYTYEEFIAELMKVDAEYKELFGCA
jgi:hypothetical protein